MKRNFFLLSLNAMLFGLWLQAEAQQAMTSRIGILMSGSPERGGSFWRLYDKSSGT